jgi:hypothetical protein
MTRDEIDDLVRVLIKTYGLDLVSDPATTHHLDLSVQSDPLEGSMSRGPSDLGLHELRPMTEEAIRLENVCDDPEYNVLQDQQSDELERFRLFEHKQRKALNAHYARAVATVESEHMQRRDEKERAHEFALERLEEMQIAAELEMRKSHEDEAQRVATALKYMERYCRGSIGAAEQPDSTRLTGGEPQIHTVSDEDRSKLQRQYAIRDNLPNKQESAINVLRAKQEKQLKAKQHQQGGELAELEAQLKQQRLALEASQAKDEEKLESILENRKRRLTMRWELKMEIWRCQYEKDKEPILGWLPKIEWPEAILSEKASEADSYESALDALIAPDGSGVDRQQDGLKSSVGPSPTLRIVEVDAPSTISL